MNLSTKLSAIISSIVIVGTVTMLTACGNTRATSDAKGYEVGDVLYHDNQQTYVYGGRVYDSLVINENSKMDGKQQLYYSIGKGTLIKLPHTNFQFVVNDLDVNTYKVSIEKK
ncbi:hypothetical protein PP175_27890 (plasmid) [Aneurinibacillus sp. Ricciae_BoGa-3]|uniref:hypothetical protein n=1 Tax=Aneurinibacillus sp. Ricciae_BoGa-3 TaxID=3022697 RepID=UPI0023420F51|nr:hypothetical protein [Aneurinibacillus sp. Ricciae_BoGa-3]WCK57015.1 hypothetical protein PP175_27890 [Aneurinibacillus sp. Ricciae_BoGa-3]